MFIFCMISWFAWRTTHHLDGRRQKYFFFCFLAFVLFYVVIIFWNLWTSGETMSGIYIFVIFVSSTGIFYILQWWQIPKWQLYHGINHQKHVKGVEPTVISTQQRCSKYRSVYMLGLIVSNAKCHPDCFARTPLFSPLLAVIWLNAGSEWIIVDCVVIVSVQMYRTQKRSFLCLYARWEFYAFVTENIDNKFLIFRRPGSMLWDLSACRLQREKVTLIIYSAKKMDVPLNDVSLWCLQQAAWQHKMDNVLGL